MLKLAEIELLLPIAVSLSQNSIKDIAAKSGIKPSTLYKWKSTNVHLSPKKMDTLFSYFTEEEPLILVIAEIVKSVLIILYIDSVFSSEEEVTE